MENLNALIGPFCLSQKSQPPHLRSTNREGEPGASLSGPLICDALGALLDEVVLKAVPIVVPDSARSSY